MFTMAVRFPADTDTWWHLKSGQYIIEQGAIPTTDPFSHTRAGQLWIDHGWLAQAGWYGLFALLGWPGLSLGLAALVTVSFWLIWLITPGNPFTRAFTVILGAITSSLIWVVRPQMVSFLLAALLLYLLERYKRDGKCWLFYGLPVIIVLWANIHGGYAIAFMILAGYLAGETVNRLTQHTADPVLSWRQMGYLGLLMSGSFLLVAINPHGWQMWVYPFRTVGITVLRDFIQEWQSPDFHQPITWPFVLMILLTLTVISQLKRRVDWCDLAMLGLWFVWSLFAARNIGLYGLLTVPALGRYLSATIGTYLPDGETSLTYHRPFLMKLNWAILGVVVLACCINIGSIIFRPNQADPSPTNLPVAAVDYLQTHQPSGPIFNAYNWGGYLIYTLWPDYPVYIDGRTDLYDDVFIRRYIGIINAQGAWSKQLDDDGINLVLIEVNTALATMLRQHHSWQMVYQDEQAIIFVRRL